MARFLEFFGARIVHRYRRLGAVLVDPDIGDDYLTAPATRATLTLA